MNLQKNLQLSSHLTGENVNAFPLTLGTMHCVFSCCSCSTSEHSKMFGIQVRNKQPKLLLFQVEMFINVDDHNDFFTKSVD